MKKYLLLFLLVLVPASLRAAAVSGYPDVSAVSDGDQYFTTETGTGATKNTLALQIKTYVLSAALVPGATAGGDLSGTYPNPTVEKFNGQLPSYYLAYSNQTGRPTSVAGLGITNGTAIDSWGTKTAPAGDAVGTTDAQTLTNKSIAASEVNSGTLAIAQIPIGTSSSTAAAGNDTRITGALSAATAATTYAPISGSANYAPATGSTHYAPISGSTNYAPASGSANYAPASGSVNYQSAASLGILDFATNKMVLMTPIPSPTFPFGYADTSSSYPVVSGTVIVNGQYNDDGSAGDATTTTVYCTGSTSAVTLNDDNYELSSDLGSATAFTFEGAGTTSTVNLSCHDYSTDETGVSSTFITPQTDPITLQLSMGTIGTFGYSTSVTFTAASASSFTLSGTVGATGNWSLTIDVSAATSVTLGNWHSGDSDNVNTGSFTFTCNATTPTISSISAPNQNFGDYLAGPFDVTSVDAILNVYNSATSGGGYFASLQIGGSSATPDATGLGYESSLVANGVTVTTN